VSALEDAEVEKWRRVALEFGVSPDSALRLSDAEFAKVADGFSPEELIEALTDWLVCCYRRPYRYLQLAIEAELAEHRKPNFARYLKRAMLKNCCTDFAAELAHQAILRFPSVHFREGDQSALVPLARECAWRVGEHKRSRRRSG